jgi:hypothetical protein
MEENIDSLKIFPIVFNNQVIQISYNKIFPEFKNKTVKSLIELVLEKSPYSNKRKDANEYNLFCPCGNMLEMSQFLHKDYCKHKLSQYKINDSYKGKYLLIEKFDQDLYDIIKENEKELSKEEINKIINEKKDIKLKKINKKKNNSKNIANEINDNLKKPFMITDEFKKKINEYIIKEKRANKIISQDFSLFYDENSLLLLLSMGISNNKAKAALRMSRNQVNEAVLIATANEINWEDKDYLFYNNDEVIDRNASNENLKKEVQKEYPFLNEEQVQQRILDIFEILGNREAKDKILSFFPNLSPRNILGHYFDDEDDDEEENI